LEKILDFGPMPNDFVRCIRISNDSPQEYRHSWALIFSRLSVKNPTYDPYSKDGCRQHNIDAHLKGHDLAFPVIPAKAGIQFSHDIQ